MACSSEHTNRHFKLWPARDRNAELDEVGAAGAAGAAAGAGAGAGAGARMGSGSNNGSGSKNDSGSSSGSSSGSNNGSTVAHEGDSKQHARSSRPEAEATAGEAMDLDGISTAAGPAAPPGATTHGPAAEALQLQTAVEGAEYDAETEDGAEVSEAPVAATAAVGIRPPRPADWGTLTRVQKANGKKHGGKRR